MHNEQVDYELASDNEHQKIISYNSLNSQIIFKNISLYSMIKFYHNHLCPHFDFLMRFCTSDEIKVKLREIKDDYGKL